MFTNHSEMVAALVKPGEAIIQSLTPLKAHLWHMASCVMGEVGELVEAVNNSDNYEDIIEELGDIEFYLEGIRRPLSIEREPEANHLTKAYDLTDLAIKAGDLFDVIKKHIIYNKELDMQATIASLAAFDAVLHSIRVETNVTRAETLEANLAKLNKRYSEGKFSDAQAQARADKLQEAGENATA